MTNDAAFSILENMAIDMTGALAGLSKKDPMCDVIQQRIEAINMAQIALNPGRTNNMLKRMLSLNELQSMNDQKVLAIGDDGEFHCVVKVSEKNVLLVNKSGNAMPAKTLIELNHVFFREPMNE